MPTVDAILALLNHPAQTGRRAVACRSEIHGHKIWIREGRAPLTHPWPGPRTIANDDRVAVAIDPTPEARRAYAEWLLAIADQGSPAFSLAPSSSRAAGIHPLWCIAAARLSLPATVRIEARHDLLGIRLAQIALGFGADTFSGPLEPDRKLPLAGITRPSENTPAGIATLIQQAGFDPTESP